MDETIFTNPKGSVETVASTKLGKNDDSKNRIFWGKMDNCVGTDFEKFHQKNETFDFSD